MRKIIFSVLVALMVFGSIFTLVSCKSDSEVLMEKSIQEAKDAVKEIREIRKDAEDIMKKP